MANYNFKKDIHLGHRGEDIIQQMFVGMGAKILETNDTNSHDFTILHHNQRLKVECKTDVYKNTGNYFVETMCRGKKSGINVTKSDIFVTYFVNENEIWYAKVESIRRLINDFPHKKISMGGDLNSKTEGLLIRKEKYKNYFNIHKVNPMLIYSFKPHLNNL